MESCNCYASAHMYKGMRAVHYPCYECVSLKNVENLSLYLSHRRDQTNLSGCSMESCNCYASAHMYKGMRAVHYPCYVGTSSEFEFGGIAIQAWRVPLSRSTRHRAVPLMLLSLKIVGWAPLACEPLS